MQPVASGVDVKVRPPPWGELRVLRGCGGRPWGLKGMSMPRPHIAPGLEHLRGWVTLAASVAVACALVQPVIFAFARYTDVRYAHLEPERVTAPLIVSGPVPAMPAPAARDARDARVDPNRVRSAADRNMQIVTNVSAAAGTISAGLLALLCAWGVVIASGASAPGLDRLTRAGVWGTLLALAGLPWASFGPEHNALMPGIYAVYSTLTLAAEAGGALSGVLLHVGLPLLAALMSGLVIVWFRSGTDRGVIVTSVSQLDELIEHEAAQVAARGPSAIRPGVARAVGTLDRAIGERPASAALRPAGATTGSPALQSAADADVAPSLLRAARPGGGSRRPI